MYISWSVHLKESCFKVAVCVYHEVFISTKVVLKLQYAYIIKCSSQGKLFKVALCVFIIQCSSQGKLFKVAVCIYHQLFITRKVV